MSLMLHRGAEPIDYDGLRSLVTPEATATHVPVPHFRLVDLVSHSLGYYGHEIVDRAFGITGQVAERPDITRRLHQVIDGVCEAVH